MNQQLVDGVTAAVNNVFRDMLGMDVTVRQVATDNAPVKSDVAGIIGIAGNITGSIVFHATKELATRVAGAFLGMEVNEINDDVKDVVGEMANMIAGGASTAMSGAEHAFEISLPTVVSGDRFDIRPLAGSDPWTTVHLESGGLGFAVDLCVKANHR